jgi:hypothetical protein
LESVESTEQARAKENTAEETEAPLRGNDCLYFVFSPVSCFRGSAVFAVRLAPCVNPKSRHFGALLHFSPRGSWKKAQAVQRLLDAKRTDGAAHKV